MRRLEVNNSLIVGPTESRSNRGITRKWRLESGEWVKESKHGYESKVEGVISDILDFSTMLQEHYTRYEVIIAIVVDEGREEVEACVSQNFLGKGDIDYTFWKLIKEKDKFMNVLNGNKTVEGRYRFIVEFIAARTGLDVSDYIKRTVALDYLFLNEDRHLNNFSVIYNEENGYSECPIFDNGLSLLSDTTFGYPEDGTPVRNYIRKVKAKGIFSTNLKRQYEVICQGVPTFTINRTKYIDYIEANRKSLGRMRPILLQRLEACPEFFTDDIKEETLGF